MSCLGLLPPPFYCPWGARDGRGQRDRIERDQEGNRTLTEIGMRFLCFDSETGSDRPEFLTREARVDIPVPDRTYPREGDAD